MKMPPRSGQRTRKYVVPSGSLRSRPTLAAKLRAKRDLRGLVSSNTPFRPACRPRPRPTSCSNWPLLPPARRTAPGRHKQSERLCVVVFARCVVVPLAHVVVRLPKVSAPCQNESKGAWLHVLTVAAHVPCLVSHASHTLHQCRMRR
jgi:hypothetical protein